LQTNGDAVWKERLDGLLANTFKVFFPDNIAYEVACETGLTCTTDMYSFKGYIHRWLSTVAQVAPYTAEKIRPILKDSTAAAVKQCVGGDTGRACGFSWSSGKFDGKMGAGQEMNVLGAVSALLSEKRTGPVTAKTGGTSQGDPSAGSESDDVTKPFKPLTTADKAGAGILTFFILAAAAGTFGWMSLGA
jgi:mannan endo-1,6-alpha-mannosidase